MQQHNKQLLLVIKNNIYALLKQITDTKNKHNINCYTFLRNKRSGQFYEEH